MENKVLGLVDILKTAMDREVAFKYIKDNKISVAALKQVAKENELYANPKWNKERLVESIVEATIGSRLKMRALMGR